MTCLAARQVIHRALDKDLSERDLEGLQAHLRTCEECRTRFDEIKSMKAALRQRLGTAPLPTSLWTRVSRGMTRAEPKINAPRVSGPAALSIIALSLVMVGSTVARNRSNDNMTVINEDRVLAAWDRHQHSQKCEMIRAASLAYASDWLSGRVEYRVPPFDLKGERLQLVAAMVCRCWDSKTPVYVWQRERGQLLYLYVLPSQQYVFACGAARSCHSPQEANVRGIGVAGLFADQYLICAMSGLPEKEFRSFVQRMPELVNGVRH